jgi:hypothetical protein
MIKNFFKKHATCIVVSLSVVVFSFAAGIFYVHHTDDERNTSLNAPYILSSIYMPYSYKDSAYDLGVKGCDNPSCVELSAGFTQGKYDKTHEDLIQIVGQVDIKNTNLDTKSQLRFICSYAVEKYSCRATTIVVAKAMVDGKAVALLDYYLGSEDELQVVSVTKDSLIARSHFLQSAGGKEYRLDRKNRKLSVVFYEDGKIKGEVIYPSDTPVETLVEKFR